MTDIEAHWGTETVLVVDDDEDARRAMQRTLDFHGYTALAVADAEGALDVLGERSGDIDLVVVDVVLPGVSGPELARTIGDRFPDTRILFTSGYTDRSAVDDEGRGGRTNFVEKPMTIRQLAEKVREVLDGDHGDPDP